MSEFVVKFVLADNSNEDAIQEAAKVCVVETWHLSQKFFCNFSIFV